MTRGQGSTDWLASLIEETEVVFAVEDKPPEVGAIAASLLLYRHGIPSGDYGIIESNEPELGGIGISGRRFVSPEAREQGTALVAAAQARTKTAGA